jgi:hypothetical protein
MKKMFTLGALALILFSCKKEKPESSLAKTDLAKFQQVEAMATKDANLDFIAKQLAGSLNKAEMRQFIKNEALKKFDGDYNILFDLIKSRNVGGKAFKNQLATNYLTNREEPNLLNNVNFIASSLPLLNISVPANIERWDTENFIPLVAVIASDYDEKTPKLIKAFDSNGKIQWLDPKKMPNFPVIAIGLNERAVINSSGKAELKTAAKSPIDMKNFSPDRQMVLPPPGDDGGGGGGGTTPPCTARVDGQREYMDAIIFPGDYLQQVYEDWILGAPELRLSIFKPTNNFTTLGVFYQGFYEPTNRADVNNDWDHFYGEWPLFSWYNAEYGNIVIYKWVEEDGGTFVTIPISHEFTTPAGKTTLSGTLTIRNDDDLMPTIPVDQRETFCPKIYGDPTFKFELKYQ